MRDHFGSRFVLATYLGGFGLLLILSAFTPDRATMIASTCELGCAEIWLG